MAARGPQNGRRGLGAPVNFHQISFFYPSTPSMRKGCDGEEKWKKKKILVKIAFLYHHASQLPEWRPTGTATDWNGNRLELQHGQPGQQNQQDQ